MRLKSARQVRISGKPTKEIIEEKIRKQLKPQKVYDEIEYDTNRIDIRKYLMGGNLMESAERFTEFMGAIDELCKSDKTIDKSKLVFGKRETKKYHGDDIAWWDTGDFGVYHERMQTQEEYDLHIEFEVKWMLEHMEADYRRDMRQASKQKRADKKQLAKLKKKLGVK